MELVNERLQYPRGVVGNDIYLFTANSVVRSNGCLVMGAGNAKAVRDIYKGIDKQFGRSIDNLSVFGLQFVEWNGQWIGAFQTKIDWKDKSPLSVVQYSIDALQAVATKRPNHTFHLPFPAINHGGKSVDEILPLLEVLPDNVLIYFDK